MRLRVSIPVLFGAIVYLFFLFSCNGNSPDIGIAMPETSEERWITDGVELLENASRLGYKAKVAFGDGDQVKQNRQIEEFIDLGVDLIVVSNINTGINSVLEEAASVGINVISYDRLLMDTGAFNYYITFDLERIGYLQASSLVEALEIDESDSPKNIVLFAGSPTDNNAYFFYDSAMKVLNPFIKEGKLNVVGPYPRTSADKANFQRIAIDGWRVEEARARMANILSNEAKDLYIDAVLAPNDSVARVVYEVCSNDKKYSSADTIPLITGQDGELATVKYILEGKQYMTVFKDSRILARAAMDLADSVLKGESPVIPEAEKTTFNTNVRDVPAFLLEPVLVTRDNVEQIIIDSGYYTEEQLAAIGL